MTMTGTSKNVLGLKRNIMTCFARPSCFKQKNMRKTQIDDFYNDAIYGSFYEEDWFYEGEFYLILCFLHTQSQVLNSLNMYKREIYISTFACNVQNKYIKSQVGESLAGLVSVCVSLVSVSAVTPALLRF